MNYELNLTTSPLRGTPPKNYSVIFKRRVAALIGYIIPPIHCVAGGELGADAWISDHLGSLSHSSYFSAKNKRRVAALIGSIVPTKILAESQEESCCSHWLYCSYYPLRGRRKVGAGARFFLFFCLKFSIFNSQFFILSLWSISNISHF